MSDDAFNVLMGAVSEPCFLLDAVGVVHDANAALCAFCGRSREALIGNVLEFMPASRSERARFFAAIAASPHHEAKYQAVGGDGYLREVELSSRPLGDGELRLVILRDHSNSRELWDELDRYRFIVQSSRDLVSVLDHGGGILFANSAHEELLGRAPEDLVGTSLFDHVHQDDLAGLWRLLTQVVPDGSGEAELRMVGLDERARHMRCLVSHIPSNNGVVFFAKDTTRQHELQQALTESQKMEGIGRLARGIAHDFNNLLQLILGAVQCLDREEDVPDELARWHKTIRSAAERGRNLVNQLQAFSKRDIGVRLPHTLEQLLGELVELVRPMVSGRCEMDIANRRGDVVVEVDVGQVMQVLVNLVINAFEAMEDEARGLIHIETRLVQRRGQTLACIAVCDNARGIREDDLDKIFEPFFSTKKGKKGTGLGLAVAYSIVEAHGGRLEVDSKPGKGSEFRVLLPRASEGIQAVAIETPLGDEDEDAMVLVVNPEPAQRTTLHKLLESLGYAVLTADNHTHALDLFEDYRDELDCVILSVGLSEPKLEVTVAAIDALRADIPILLTSGFPEFSYEGEFERVFDVLPKPFSAEHLRSTLRRALRSTPLEQPAP